MSLAHLGTNVALAHSSARHRIHRLEATKFVRDPIHRDPVDELQRALELEYASHLDAQRGARKLEQPRLVRALTGRSVRHTGPLNMETVIVDIAPTEAAPMRISVTVSYCPIDT
jgi:hypothetical protein